MKSKPNRNPQINKGTRKSAFILSINSSAAIHPAQAPLNQGLIHPDLKIINFLNLRKIACMVIVLSVFTSGKLKRINHDLKISPIPQAVKSVSLQIPIKRTG